MPQRLCKIAKHKGHLHFRETDHIENMVVFRHGIMVLIKNQLYLLEKAVKSLKLLFKQRLFSWFDSYDIYDETGNTVYVVKGQLSWGHKLVIYDA